VVWFGETLDSDILTAVEEELEKCDLCLVVSDHTCMHNTAEIMYRTTYPQSIYGHQDCDRSYSVSCNIILPSLIRHFKEIQN